MNTTTAAAKAGVSTATIRIWCRIGAVAAIKTAGRWIIDAASLAYRLTLGRKPAMTSIEHHVDDTTTIRVDYVDSGLGPAGFIAVEYRNGYRIGTVGDGRTAKAALDKALGLLAHRDAREAEREALEATGLYADLTTSPRQGIHRQMQATFPSAATSGHCHYCGLDARTCDCV